MSRTPRSHRRVRRIALPLVALAAAVAARPRLARRRAAIEHVAADLRNPILYVPLSLRSDRSLRVLRQLSRAPIPPPTGVEVDSRLARSDDGPDVRVVTYGRADRRRPSGALLWIHGGGMVMGRPEQGREL